MAKYRTVKRIYFKKNGDAVVKEYRYRVIEKKHVRANAYGSSGKHKLVNKNGKKTAYYDKYVDAINRNKQLTADEKRSLKNELDAYIRSYQMKGKALTNATFESHLQNTRVDRYFYNIGGNISDVIADINDRTDLGLTEDELRNSNNWDWENQVFSIAGRRFGFTFSYEEGGVTWKIL